jgi:hypothetical protein
VGAYAIGPAEGFGEVVAVGKAAGFGEQRTELSVASKQAGGAFHAALEHIV